MLQLGLCLDKVNCLDYTYLYLDKVNHLVYPKITIHYKEVGCMPISSSEENNQLLEAQNLPIDRKLFQNSKKKKISKTVRLIEGVRLIQLSLYL